MESIYNASNSFTNGGNIDNCNIKQTININIDITQLQAVLSLHNQLSPPLGERELTRYEVFYISNARDCRDVIDGGQIPALYR